MIVGHKVVTAVEEGIIVGSIAGTSALAALSATTGLPTATNIYTAGLAACLAGLVRYATVRQIDRKG